MSDSLFTIHQFTIPVKELNKPIYIIPFGDIHRFAPLCHTEKWKEFLNWAKKKDRCYFIGMGDYDDLSSFSERRVLSSQDLHESSRQSLDDYYAERTKNLIDEIHFMRGGIIGLLEGNHYSKFSTNSEPGHGLNFIEGQTTTQMMCQYLQCKYLGVSSFIKLSLPYQTKASSKDLWVHHGLGAARLVGGSLNKVQQMVDSAQADIYLMGHDHKKSVAMKSILHLSPSGDKLRLNHKKILLGRTGSFLKGYEPECDSYVAGAGLSPTDMGVIKIELTPKRQQIKKENIDIYYVDIHASI